MISTSPTQTSLLNSSFLYPNAYLTQLFLYLTAISNLTCAILNSSSFYLNVQNFHLSWQQFYPCRCSVKTLVSSPISFFFTSHPFSCSQQETLVGFIYKIYPESNHFSWPPLLSAVSIIIFYLDYCSNIFTNLPTSTLAILKPILKRLILLKSKLDHITPVLKKAQ